MALIVGGVLAVIAVIVTGLVLGISSAIDRQDKFERACDAAGGWVHHSDPPMCIVDGRITRVEQ